MNASMIQSHNVRAAATWNSAGRHYDRVSQSIADAIEHCIVRLAPTPGEHILDVATGTGWAARRMVARGASVIGLDLGADLIEAARAYAAEARLLSEWRVGDAEALPCDDHSFDAVISTFGVMFVSKPEVAAAELARVCKRGGRLGLATWPANDTVAGLLKVMQPCTSYVLIHPGSGLSSTNASWPALCQAAANVVREAMCGAGPRRGSSIAMAEICTAVMTTAWVALGCPKKRRSMPTMG